MGCVVRGGKNGMGCFVRGGKNCMGCFVWVEIDVGCFVRGVKNGMGCFVPGCFVLHSITTFILFFQSTKYEFFLTFDSDKPPAHTSS